MTVCQMTVCWMAVCRMTVWQMTVCRMTISGKWTSVECPNIAEIFWDDLCFLYFRSRSSNGFTPLCFSVTRPMHHITSILFVQVNLCQKHLFSQQLTHHMTTDCLLIYQFNWIKTTISEHGENMLCTQIVFCVFLTFRTIFAHNMFSPCFEHVVLIYWNGKSMNNFLQYSGLVDLRISASDKDIPVTQH